METLSTALAGNEALQTVLEKNCGLDDPGPDAPAAMMNMEHSFASGKIKGSRWAARGSLNQVVTVKAGRLWSDEDLDERLEFKILEEFVFSNSKTPRNASDWMDVGTAITEVKAINKKDKTVTEPWSTIVEEIRGATKGIRIVLVP